jgi:predicted KAP-like P-loop ATPase
LNPERPILLRSTPPNMDTETNVTSPFSSDRPIERAADDRLGRAPFADAIGRALSFWQGKDSLVIALYAPWGAGKSSVKNIALESLRGHAEPPTVVEFNPWEWSGSAELRNAFFTEVGRHLGVANAGRTATDLQKRWAYYAAMLGVDVKPTDAVVRQISGAVSVVAALSFFQSLLADPSIRSYGSLGMLLLALLTGAVAFVRTLSDYLSKLFSARAAFKDVSVETRKAQLADELRKLRKPVVIVIDDLDRLTPAEIRTMTQLVKANVDLPNLVYLLLGDREILAAALTHDSVDGTAYLEKIVQVPFDLPSADQRQIDEVLFSRLNVVLARPGVDAHFEQQRWANLYLESLRPYFTSLRRVNRFASTFDFHASVLLTGTTLEVNVIDLIALEVLRVFEPSVYRQLPGLKRILTNPIEKTAGIFVTTDQDAHRAIDPVLEPVPEPRRQRVKEILKELFPHTHALWGGSRYSRDHADTWLREMRVASEDRFDRYFQMIVPGGDISQAVIADILANAGNREATRATLAAFHQRELLPRLFDLLDSYKESIAPGDVVPFCTAVFDVGDLVPRRSEAGFFEMGTDMHAVRVVRWALKGLDDISAREGAFEKAVADTSGLYLPVMRVKLEEDFHKENKSEALVRDASLELLRARCVEKMAAAAAGNTLQKNRHLAYLVWRWQHWSEPGVVPKWIASLLESPEGTVDLLRGFSGVGRTVSAGDRVAKTHRFLRLSDLKDLLSLDDLERALSSTEQLSLSEEEKEILVTTREAFARHRSGKSDDLFQQ